MEAWEKVTSDRFILGCVTGYRIEFYTEVIQVRPPIQKDLSLKEMKALETSIGALLKKGAIEPCKPHKRQFLSSYFLVPKSDDTSRFILNLKGLNEFILTPHFKIEGIRTATGLVFPNYFMSKIDLEDAYFTVPVHASSRKFLRFVFRGQLYQFVCLPFGLSISPFIFTKLLKPVVTYLRSQGCLLVVYLDDFLCIGSDSASLGFIINQRKSCFVPATRCEILGFIIDSSHYVLELPVNKKEAILSCIKGLMRRGYFSILDWAKLIGRLVAACPAVEYGAMYTKALERVKTLALIKNNFSYKEKMSLPRYILPDLAWWINKIPLARNSFKTFDFAMELFTDASNTGWGATTGSREAHGFWSDSQKSFHINYKELLAVRLALETLASGLENCQILLRVDNTTAIAYVNKMGGVRYEPYNKLAKEIWQWAERRNNFLFASYISSSENTEADRLSRLVNHDIEWELNDKFFTDIEDFFGKPEVDLFASKSNAKCKYFFSCRPEPGTAGVDAFTMNWSGIKFYAFPPFSMILKTLAKIRQDGASGILVVPFWCGQPWFPLFKSLLIEEELLIGPDANLLLSPCRKKTHPQAEHLQLIVGRVSGRPL